MKTKYRKFKLTLWTLGPVHIGSGQLHTAREYILEGDEYYFPDMTLLYDELIKRGIDEKFQKFLIDSENKTNRIRDFLAEHGITKRDFGGYRLKATGLENPKEENATRNQETTNPGEINGVHQFMRDCYGNPYVPGSSLKGAIRTILMNTHWHSTDFKQENKKGEIVENKKAIPWGPTRRQRYKELEPFDDIFNEIRVSDSQPLTNDDLILVQKWDFTPDDTKPHSLSIYREALRPGTKMEFEIITALGFKDGRAGELVASLGEYAQKFYFGVTEDEGYEGYKDFFLKKFPNHLIQNNLSYPLYLGGGSGAWTKTVFRQADGEVQKRHKKMSERGALKLTKAPFLTVEGEIELINNAENFYEMGKTCFTITEEATR